MVMIQSFIVKVSFGWFENVLEMQFNWLNFIKILSVWEYNKAC